jgi:hypothetical protein
MRLGVFTFLNDTGIGPVDVAVALETRGFGSLFVTEHSHIPVKHENSLPDGRSDPAAVLPDARSVRLADGCRRRHRVAAAGYRHIAGHTTRPDPDGQRSGLAGPGVLAGCRDLGIEHVTVELPIQPRDETLRRLDALHAEYAKLG